MKKVKVVFDQSRLVVPCGNGQDRVERLVEDINKRFQRHLGDPTARAKELTTNDGFLLNPRDLIDQVVDDGAVLIALNYDAWLKSQLTLLEPKGNYKMSRPDYAKGSWRPPYRYCEIGRHKHNKIYVKIGSDLSEVKRLELFDAESLRTFGSEGKALIAHEEVKKREGDADLDWSVQVHFIIEKGLVVAAELSVRTSSDPRAQIEVVPINVADMTLGEVVVKQTSAFPKPDKTYTMAETKTEGPSFSADQFESAHLAPSGIKEPPVPENNVATGDLGIEIKQKDVTQPDQGWFNKGQGTFVNKFYNHISLFNPLEKEVAIVKITSEYCANNNDNEWTAMTSRFGSKDGYYRYSFGYNDGCFVLEPNERINLAVESGVEVRAHQYDRARRAHGSLPDPLRVRITLEDKEGKQARLVITNKNGPLYLHTREWREQSQGRTGTDFWLSADDMEAEDRVWFEAVHKKEDKRVEFASKPSDKSLYCYDSNLDLYLYEARKKHINELEVEELSTKDEDKGYSQKVTALVDLENNWVYAFRVELRTNTSSVVGYYPMPDL